MIPMPVVASAVGHSNNNSDASGNRSPANVDDSDTNEYEYDFINVQQPNDASVAVAACGGDTNYEQPPAFDRRSSSPLSPANTQKTNDEYAYAYDNVRQPDADEDDGEGDGYQRNDDYEPANSYEALPDDHEANPEIPPPYDSLRLDSSPQWSPEFVRRYIT